MASHRDTLDISRKKKKTTDAELCKKSDLNGALKVFGRMREERMT